MLEGAEQVGVEGATVFNHASTVGLNAIITRRLPKIGFLTTEGHRDILDVGRTWRPLEALTDPGWRRSFGDAARPLVPRYLRRGVKERLLATGETLIELDEDQARAQLEVLKKLQRRRRRDLPDQRLRQRRPRGAPARARLRGAGRRRRGLDLGRGLTAGQGVPARVDDRRRRVHEADLHRPTPTASTTGLHELGFPGQLNFADCAAQLVARDHAMAAPFRVVFSGPAAGTVSARALRRADRRAATCCAPTSAARAVTSASSPTASRP